MTVDNQVDILVIGDFIIDRYFHVESTKLSEEALIPVLKVTDCEERPGGAGKTANSLAEILRIVGATDIKGMFAGLIPPSMKLDTGITSRAVIPSLVGKPENFFCYKNRVVSKYPYQQIARFDQDVFVNLEEYPSLRDSVIYWVTELLKSSDSYKIVIISDYEKGLIDEKLLQAVKALSETVIVDPRSRPAKFYSKYADIITPNKKEYDLIFNDPVEDWLEPFSPNRAIIKKKGSKGSQLIYQELLPIKEELRLFKDNIPAFETSKETLSVVGAGDVFAAALAVGLAKIYLKTESRFIDTWGLYIAATFANMVAGLAVTNRNCTPGVTQEDKELIKENFEEIF